MHAWIIYKKKLQFLPTFSGSYRYMALPAIVFNIGNYFFMFANVRQVLFCYIFVISDQAENTYVALEKNLFFI